MNKPTIPILLVNVTLTFPTKNPKKFTHKTYERKVTKGTTPEMAFKFLRIPKDEKNRCCDYKIECLKNVGKTSMIDN